MRYRLHAIIIAFLFGLWGCTSQPKSSSGQPLVISLNLDAETTDVFTTDLISDVELIHLSDSVPIGRINKLLCFGDRIYIADKFLSRSVFIFNRQGALISEISRRGPGPKEYRDINDIFIDPKDTTLNIVSANSTILKYDSDGKELLSVIKLTKNYTKIQPVENRYIGYMGNVRYYSMNVWFLSSEYLPVGKGLFPISSYWNGVDKADRSVFSMYNKNTYYISLFDYDIHNLKDGKSTVPYRFDLGKYGKGDHEKWEQMSEDAQMNYRLTYASSIGFFQETDKFLFTTFIFRFQALMGIYNKDTHQSVVANLDNGSTYADKYFIPFGNIVAVDQQTIYTQIEAGMIKSICDGVNGLAEKYPTQIENLRRKFPVINEDDNPFIAIYTLK